MDISREQLLLKNNLDPQILLNDLFKYSKGADFADIYLQSGFEESWYLEDGLVKSGAYDLSQGVGVRMMNGTQTGFAYSDNLKNNQIHQAFKSASAILKNNNINSKSKSSLNIKPKPNLFYSQDYISHAAAEKINLLKSIDYYLHQKDSRVTQVMASLSISYEHIGIIGTDGTDAFESRPLIRLSITVILKSKNNSNQREQGFGGGGGRYGFSELLKSNVWKTWADMALHTAQVNLDAQPCPAGEFDIVLGAGWPGVLFHEAVGHGLEGDFNRKKTSAFSDKMGELVASEICTIVDDGTLNQKRGSLSFDDEGTPTQKNILIESGRLVGYMHDKLSARVMGVEPTGNGRRESYADIVLPRMTNTYLMPGKDTDKEIISSLENGLYAVNFSGGQVDITSGKFVFAASEAYWVKNGKIQHPVKGATLIGDGPSALKRISMVGQNMELDSGIGVCGKEGQSIPVGVGQPMLRINQVTVGGTQA